MKQLVIMILTLVSFCIHAELNVEVKPSQFSSGHLQLIIRQNSPKDSNSPDLSVLRQDFNIISTWQRSSYSVINGQAKSSREWDIELLPKKKGLITIPAIPIGKEQTKPLSIKIASSTNRHQGSQVYSTPGQDTFLKTEINPKKPVINQQLIYTVKLYNSKHLIDAEYQGPQVEDALMFPLGHGKRYHTLQNSKDYIVEEQRYAIFPQKSGQLTIKPPIFTGLVFDFDTHEVRATDHPIVLTVAPIPKDYQQAQWLPAKQISLKDEYVDAGLKLAQGSTLVRKITLQAVSLPAQLLPSLQFSSNEMFNVYSEKTNESNQIKQEELISSRSFKITYLFKKSGKVIIPELKIFWFNTETGKEEVTSLPSQSFEITPTKVDVPNSSSLNSNTQIPMQQSSQGLVTPLRTYSFWAVLAILFAVAWLITIILWIWSQRRKQPKTNSYVQPADLQAFTKACMKNEPFKAHDALLKWAKLHWPDAVILNLNDLSQLITDPHCKKQLQLLSQVLYSKKTRSSWQGHELLQCIQSLKNPKATKNNRANDLPPINPI